MTGEVTTPLPSDDSTTQRIAVDAAGLCGLVGQVSRACPLVAAGGDGALDAVVASGTNSSAAKQEEQDPAHGRAFCTADLPEVNSWYAARGRPVVPRAALPATGRIVPGVAAGFLYLTDSRLALLEGFISNPTAGLRSRARAIDQITVALLREAKRRGVVDVIGFGASPGIVRRVQQLGMRKVGVFTLVAWRA